MSIYNTFYDICTRTSISQAIDADGHYCVVFTRGSKTQVTVCNGSDHQYDVFSRNVKWYRGY